VPVKRVVPNLSSVIEYWPRRRLDDVLQGFSLKRHILLCELVQVVNISLVVFPIMEVDSFLGNVRLQSSLTIRKSGKSERSC
jgi:hypothetical protein